MRSLRRSAVIGLAPLVLGPPALDTLDPGSRGLGLPGFGSRGHAQEAALPDGFFDELRYRHIGPAGNRVIAVVGEPGDPNVYYAGAASGGVWKSTDGGHAWTPVFDDQPVSSIGSLAIAPSDPNVLWAGTGETFIRSNISHGNGIYRSTDGGETWEHRGLDATGRIGRVIVHPRDPEVVLACALGHAYAPQQDRGVYHTTDGGESWQRTLFVDENTGCADLAIDPNNPRIVFAGMWQIDVKTWGRTSGGPGSGLWRSRDGGVTWEKLEGSGLPTPPLGKIGLGISAANSDRVYALIETSSNRDFAPSDPHQGTLWRSDDGGDSWRMVNASNDLSARWLYYTRLLPSPADADEVYFMAPGHFTSLDGGETHERTRPSPGYDHHDMWIDPLDPDRMIVGHDGGVSISTNHGRSWHRPQLPIAQMYHANVDDQIPYFVYGNRQDGPSARVPSNTLAGGSIAIGEFRAVGGCEVGFAVPDTVDDRTVWSGCYDGILERHDLVTGHSRNVSVWPLAIESWPAVELRYRFQWTHPIEISPHDHETVYVGSQHVHRTTNGGQSWEVISPDLTSDDPELQQRMGGLTLDDAGPTIAPVVFAISESLLEPGVIWAGTNDGYVQLTRDGGASWTNLTPNLRGLPPRGTISNIQPSRHNPATAYLTVDRHQLGDFDPYVYKTTDYGESWTRIDGGIPRSVLSFAHCVREDPTQPGLLYLGTENGVWVTFDDGGRWHSMQSNLPHAPVHWIAVQEHFNDLVLATYGRGFWILDDITPLQQLAAAWREGTVAGAPSAGTGAARSGDDGGRAMGALLLSPRPAYRFRSRESAMSQPGDPTAGQNPEYGASLHYYLPADLDEDADLELVILDADGDTVRTIGELDRAAGLHRQWWDLRSERTREAKLRTKLAENPHLALPDDGREVPDGGPISILMPPGSYEVRLTAGEGTQGRTLTVLKDPSSIGSEADIASQMEVLWDLYEMHDRSAALIDEVEWIRRQLGDLRARLRDSGFEAAGELAETAATLAEEMVEIEGAFFDLRHTGTGQDGLRWKRLLYSRIGSLAFLIMGSDYPPTDQHLEVHRLLAAELAEVEARFEAAKAGSVGDFNRALRERGVPHIITGRSEPIP